MRKIRKFLFIPFLLLALYGAMGAKGGLPSLGSSGKAKTENCKKTGKVAVVKLSREKYPQTTFHVEQAIRMGQPRVLKIERTDTDQKRDQWARVVGEQQNLKARNLDQDEYPPAMSSDKGGAGREANIALISSPDNRGAGSSMGAKLSRYCDGQRFRIKPTGSYPGPVTITVIANQGRRMNKTVSSQ